MTDKSNRPARPLIGFITRNNAPQITPAPVSRAWMSRDACGVAQSVFADAHRKPKRLGAAQSMRVQRYVDGSGK